MSIYLDGEFSKAVSGPLRKRRRERGMRNKKVTVDDSPGEKLAYKYLTSLAKYSLNIRNRHDLTASQFSRTLGMSRGYIASLEDLRPELKGLRVATLAAFALYEGITISRLCAILEGGGQASAASSAAVPLKPFQRQLLEACEHVREDIAGFFFVMLKKFKPNKLVPEPTSWALELAAMLLAFPPTEAVLMEQHIKDTYLRLVKNTPVGKRDEILVRFREILHVRMNDWEGI